MVDSTTVPSDGQVLTWDTDTNKWYPFTPTSIPAIRIFAGQVNSTIASSPNWGFIGNSQDITLKTGQYITANFSASLGVVSGIAPTVSLCACYQNTNGGAITPFNPTNFTQAAVESNRRIFSYSGAVVPGAGTFKVGACVRNSSGFAINSNDYYSGYIQAY